MSPVITLTCARAGAVTPKIAGEVSWVIDNELVICWEGRIEGWERAQDINGDTG